MTNKPSKHVKDQSGNVSGRRIQVRAKDVAGNLTQPFQCQDATSRNTACLAPLGDGALVKTEFSRHRALTTGGLYRLFHKICPHEYPLITEIDRSINTKSDRLAWHALAMIRGQAQSTFWERLQEAAAANGIEPSQSAIARDLKVRQSAVAKWKAGGRPKTTRLEDIAKKYKYSVNWLMSEEGPKRPQGVGEPDDAAELLALWKSLPAPARKSILEQVRLIRSMVPNKKPELA